MALVKFIETTSDKLDSLPIVEGRFTFTTDGKFYLDAENASGAIERFSIHSTNFLEQKIKGEYLQNTRLFFY